MVEKSLPQGVERHRTKSPSFGERPGKKKHEHTPSPDDVCVASGLSYAGVVNANISNISSQIDRVLNKF